MSLYVGHLSPRVRQEDLEQVFRKFGRCSVQLKDGYGFAVYEVTANAERALRALKGKNICGQNISLNWSNRQPRQFQRPAKTGRFYEPFQQRISRGQNDGIEIRGSHNRRDFYTTAASTATYKHGRYSFDDTLDKETGRLSEDVVNIEGDKGVNFKEGVQNEGNTTGLDQVEDDRWRQTGIDTLDGHERENGNDFDRYEPYHGYDKRDENEDIQMDDSYGSRERGVSQEKRWKENPTEHTERNIDKPKALQTCYSCGQVGHKIRNCPKANAQREKISKLNRNRQEVRVLDKGEERLKWFRASSWGKSDASRDLAISMCHKRVRKEFHSGKDRRLARKNIGLPQSREKHRSKFKGGSPSKRKGKMEHGAAEKETRRGRTRRSGTLSPSTRSPRTNSSSCLQSLSSDSDSSSPSPLRRASSQSHSASSSSRSASISSYSKPVSSRSRSRSRSQSRSRSRSLSVSVSLEQKAAPSPKKVQVDICLNASPKGNAEKLTSLEANAKLNSKLQVLEEENPSTSLKLKNDINGGHPGHDADDAQDLTVRIDGNESSLDSDLLKDTAAAYENLEENDDQQETSPLKLKRYISTKCEGSSSTIITSQEMFLALKHYGLAAAEQSLPGLTVGEYFGAARLWPWEIIYYRRFKKGPISTENYARRCEQNREFGIVDKYIRSSSGWGECNEDDT